MQYSNHHHHPDVQKSLLCFLSCYQILLILSPLDPLYPFPPKEYQIHLDTEYNQSIYYFLIHPNIIHSIEWLAGNLWFSFFVGLFYGVFLIDVGYSLNILNNIQKFAKENDIIVQYEAFRKHIGELRNEFKEKERFVFSMKLDHISIKKSLKAYFDKYYK